ncbi:type II secretion system minor pseudopilin GspI [Pseudomonas sp. JR33AA]|uniref:type II secretion system minor pseudopilin GspI n=1 Tax=Pseudomonas sp. JR33AA TaxID=2899113 RepID=UPI001F47685E|nr:type II secretion system minor pseudopilin GspI [Pseudomonas sp. JR33AA]MCE5975624.1 type II secretion system minor pseudopilin GspI [Pseudomonas sp. JR33AA]
MTPGFTSERGFTLLEVLVALAIFAVLAAAVTAASQHVLAQTQGARDRLFASWIADNRLTELGLNPPPVAGQRAETVVFDQRTWFVRESRHHLIDVGLIEVSITVGLDADRTVLHQAMGWLEGGNALP